MLLNTNGPSNIIISNSCLGYIVSNYIYNGEYNNPFIGTLIPEDLHFLKLCENLKYYMNCEPTCDYNPSNTTEYSKQTNGIWYNNPEVPKIYPIIHLEDIELHCIHETSIEHTLETFKRRIERFKYIVNSNNYKIFNILTWTNLFTEHSNNDYRPYISQFLNNNNKQNDLNMTFLFLGPTNYIKDEYYIDYDIFSLDIKRRIDNVNVQIDFFKEAPRIVYFLIYKK